MIRVRGFTRRKRGEFIDDKAELSRLKKMRGGRTGPFPKACYKPGLAPGDFMFENTTISGERYKQLMEMEGGILDMIEWYFKPETRPANYSTSVCLSIDLEVDKLDPERATRRLEGPARSFLCRIQEDGAPGHGFDNLHNRGTLTHDSLKWNCSQRGMVLVKQSRHSPETNTLDLGVWSCLKAGVDRRGGKRMPRSERFNHEMVEAAMWRAAQESGMKNLQTPKCSTFFVKEEKCWN